MISGADVEQSDRAHQQLRPDDRQLVARLRSAANRLIDSAYAAHWRGIDPHDGLYWRWPRVLVATPRRRQVIVQLHVRAPLDIRFWRRGERPLLAKTLALFTKAPLLMADGPDSGAARLGRAAAESLDSDRAAGEEAWGYPFSVQTRWSGYGANSPNVVVTSFAIDALLLAADRLGESAYQLRARRAGEWIAGRLLTRQGHFAYHEHSDVLVHNANLLGAAAVHRARAAGDDVLRRAVELTLKAQRPDGSWPYGAGSRLGFIDSFHTGYVITSLLALDDVGLDVGPAVKRGSAYWIDHFFDSQGRSLMWPDRAFPEDGHSAGTALSTLALLAERDGSYLPVLRRVSERALDAMVDGGHAVHRRQRWGPTRVSYLRWCDGHMAVGMAAAANTLAS